MLRINRTIASYFPLGFSSGPLNKHLSGPLNNELGHPVERLRAGRTVPERVQRHALQLKCHHCRFAWHFDTLTVRCNAEPKLHYQREHWLHPFWMWGKDQPYEYHKYLGVTKNPRTGMFLARESAKSKNNERRSQGLTTRTMNMNSEQQGISREVCKIGQFSQRWQTRFPFPT